MEYDFLEILISEIGFLFLTFDNIYASMFPTEDVAKLAKALTDSIKETNELIMGRKVLRALDFIFSEMCISYIQNILSRWKTVCQNINNMVKLRNSNAIFKTVWFKTDLLPCHALSFVYPSPTTEASYILFELPLTLTFRLNIVESIKVSLSLIILNSTVSHQW